MLSQWLKLSRPKKIKTPEEILNIVREKLGKEFRSWDDPKDKAAIKLGIWLYRIRPGWVWTEDVVSQVRLSPISLRAQPYRP